MSFVDQSNNNHILIKCIKMSIYGKDSLQFKTTVGDKIKEMPSCDVHLDLGIVKYIDSAMIGTLLYFIQVLKKSQKKIVIDKITPELKELLETLMLEKYIEIPATHV